MCNVFARTCTPSFTHARVHRGIIPKYRCLINNILPVFTMGLPDEQTNNGVVAVADNSDVEVNESDEDWSDEEEGVAKSLFEHKEYETATDCALHMKKHHTFDLTRVIGSGVYDRVILVNFLRKLGPEDALTWWNDVKKKAEIKNKPSEKEVQGAMPADIFSDEAMLQPVVEDDPLLFYEDETAEEHAAFDELRRCA